MTTIGHLGEEVVAALRERGGTATTQEVAETVGVGWQSALVALGRLASHKESPPVTIVEQGRPTRGQEAVWGLSEAEGGSGGL